MHEINYLFRALQRICDATIFVSVISNDTRDVDSIFTVLGDGASVKGSPKFRIVVVLIFDNYVQRGCKYFYSIIIAL